ncbi:MAG: asparagine synthase (glutamine-hydrolyzing) [Bacteroidota bacterium]
MCGIAGILVKGSGPDPYKDILVKMTAAIQHRGPDDSGTEWYGNAGLGFRRLSIIDLSPAGHQPMWDEAHRYCIIFNGEVYNYLELREELAAKGHRFRSQTDTEVILEAYKEWGSECVRRFNGMWAFVILNAESGSLFCSRDRFGVKPFYYYQDRNVFLFASEIKALLASGLFRPEENEVKSFELVALGYMDTTDETLFKNVSSLQGAHSMTVSADGSIRRERYWSVPETNTDIGGNLEGAARDFYELFLDSVKLRLRSDVPLAVLLSGGQDSSAIACVVDALRKGKLNSVEQLKTEKLHTYSSCYKDPRFDEREFIDAVVAQCNIEPHYLFPEEPDLVSDLRSLTWHMDEPVFTSNSFAHWTLMKAIGKQGIHVLLSGQGADESLAGYDRLLIGPQLVDLLDSGRFGDFGTESQLIEQKYGFSKSYVAAQVMKTMVPQAIWPALKALVVERALDVYDWSRVQSMWDAHPTVYRRKDRVSHRLMTDFVQDSLPRILHAEDRTSMAFSIEERFPFLDYRIVEFAFQLPLEMKLYRGETKRVLRKALGPILPEKIRNRSSKIGFATPTHEWTKALLKSEYIRGLLNSQQVPGVGRDKMMRLADMPFGNEQAKLLWRFVGYLVWRDVFGMGGGSMTPVRT